MARYTSPEQIKTGVVGYGGAFEMGKRHLLEMQSNGMTPTAVAELDADRLAVAETDFPGIETYSTVESMLAESDVNFITVITPHNTHAPIALQCLEAGRHVCCEKPLALTTGECESMMAAAKPRDLLLTTYHNRHWDGCILKAMQDIREDGIIGEICRIDAQMGSYTCPDDWWRSSRSISGGILYDWGAHFTEYALQLMDDELVEVTGYSTHGHWATQTPWKDDTIEDEAMAMVRFKRGGIYMLRISHLESHPHPYFIKVTGTLGCYEFSPHDKYRITTQEGGEVVVREGDEPEGEGWRFYKNVTNHLVNDEPLVITGEWATRVIHVLDLACDSAAKGRALPVTHP